MKKVTIVYEVYDFDELTEEAKNIAIGDLLMSILEVPELYPELEEEFKKAQDKCEKLYTPWFFTMYMRELAEDKLIEILQQDVYLKNGKIFKEGVE